MNGFFGAIGAAVESLKPHLEHAAGAIEGTARSVIESRHEHFENFSNAAVGTYASAAIELGQRHLSTFDSAAAMRDIKTKLQLNELKLENLPAAALKYAQENPEQAVMFTIAPLILIYPRLAWGPVLLMLGLSAGGPVAGGIFAGLQSRFGTPMAMRTFQSAAMGGAGRLVMDGATQGIVALAIGAIVAERLHAAKEHRDKQEHTKDA
ncbi:hypothetical protein CBER1_08636 [Cercospora berteroae]|uniref:Uncharacterized protein n=1 Tax=Cercospora berteroae TaxID=357750 RepID=A0A2S6BVQ0_9PEZI|nr:hypothetical protein CBER1_08636 [Cercospora berteroae]